MIGLSYSGILNSYTKYNGVEFKKYENKEVNKESYEWDGYVIHKTHDRDCDIMKDELNKCNCSGEEVISKNTVLIKGIHSIIDKLVDKDNVNRNDGFLTHIELGKSKEAAAPSDENTVLPVFRKALTEARRDGTNAILKVFLNPSEANSVSATVAIGVDQSNFELLAGNGALFDVGETIYVDGQYVEITAKTDDALTVSPALSSTLSGGETVNSTISEIVLYGGGTANSSNGTGIPFARTTTFTPKVKVPGSGETLEWHINIS